MEKRDEVEQFYTATRKQDNKKPLQPDNTAKELEQKPRYIDNNPPQSQPVNTDTKTSITTKSKSSFDPMWVAVGLLSLGLFYTMWLASQNKPELILEDHKELVMSWFDVQDYRSEILEMVHEIIPPEVIAFAKADLKPGQTMIMYWQRNGEGPTREVIEFNPDKNKEINRILSEKQ